jgi:peptidoglycan/xylan/chitin deacetylase (PgdA/CDA1 family)
MSLRDLERSLLDGVADIGAITRERTWLVRPPYWWFNHATVTQYERHGLHMVLSDLKAYDGVNWGMHVFRRWNFRSQLTDFRQRVQHEVIPAVRGVIPMVVTFHDTNAYTAGHLMEYLDLLIDEAQRVGLSVDDQPYYDEPGEILEAALGRAVHPFRNSWSGGRHVVASY